MGGRAIVLMVIVSVLLVGDIFAFANTSPDPFRLLSPENNSVIADPTPILKWERYSIENQVDHYEVWLDGRLVDRVVGWSTLHNFPGFQVGENDATSYMAPELSEGTHSWYVVAVDKAGNEHASEGVFVFNVETFPTEFSDDFEDSNLSEYVVEGIEITDSAISGSYSAKCMGPGTGYAYTSGAILYPQKAGIVSVTFVADSSDARPMVGFASENGIRVYAVADLDRGGLIVEQRRENGSVDEVYSAMGAPISTGEEYKIVLVFSRKSRCAMAKLIDISGELATTRTIVDEAPGHPFFGSEGSARFDNFEFTSNVDEWYYNWNYDYDMVLLPREGDYWDNTCVFNPAVWIENGRFYMLYRGTNQPDTLGCSIGLAWSDDGFNWTMYENNPVFARWDHTELLWSDPDIVVNPFGDGKYYLEFSKRGGFEFNGVGSGLAVSTDLIHWQVLGTMLKPTISWEGPYARITSIIDTHMYSQLDEVNYEGENYRFISYYEVKEGPSNGLAFSNDLLNWVKYPNPVLTAEGERWGNQIEAIGAHFVTPDGNIMVFTCSATSRGYHEGDSSTLSAVMDGKEPWRVIEWGTLPWLPTYWKDLVWGTSGEILESPIFPGEVVQVDNKLYYYFGNNDTATGIATATLPLPEFVVESISVDPPTVAPGESVTVSVEVVNVGDGSGRNPFELKVDGSVRNKRAVTLDPGQSTTVTFTLSVDEPGTHTVSVDNLAGSFEVSAQKSEEVPIIPVATGVVVVLVVIGAVIYWRRQVKHE